MSRTNSKRIQAAQDFIRLGYGDAVDDAAVFYSNEFLTQELSTTEVQAVLPLVQEFNLFAGERVAQAIGKFKGRVTGWQFGKAGSPLLVVVLAPWSHQVEELPPGAPSGQKFTELEREQIVQELKNTFINELDADEFEQVEGSLYKYRAWWD